MSDKILDWLDKRSTSIVIALFVVLVMLSAVDSCRVQVHISSQPAESEG